jgi:hypothetical protein
MYLCDVLKYFFNTAKIGRITEKFWGFGKGEETGRKHPCAGEAVPLRSVEVLGEYW